MPCVVYVEDQFIPRMSSKDDARTVYKKAYRALGVAAHRGGVVALARWFGAEPVVLYKPQTWRSKLYGKGHTRLDEKGYKKRACAYVQTLGVGRYPMSRSHVPEAVCICEVGRREFDLGLIDA